MAGHSGSEAANNSRNAWGTTGVGPAMKSLLQGRLARIALLAVVHFLLARMSVLLAIAPGYAAPLWPPAGVALGVLLVYPQLWPGVWLASFAANALLAFEPSVDGLVLPEALVPAGLACGATAQALLGAALVRRCVGPAPQLINEREVFKFMIFAGPIASIVSCTVSTAVLAASGNIPVHGFGFTWGTWWIGDAIGVVIFAPLVYLWLSDGEELRSRRAAVTAPLLLLFAAVLLVFVYTSRSDMREARQRFDRDAALLTASIQRHIDLGLEIVHALAGFFGASQQVDEQEFASYTRALLWRHTGLRSVFWAPRVAVDGAPLDEVTTHVQLAPANRDKYPIVFIDSRSDAVLARHFDLAADAMVREALTRARDSGASTSSPLQQGNHTESLYTFLVPLYDDALGSSPSIEERRQHLRGFAGGTFELSELAAAALAKDVSAPPLKWRLRQRGIPKLEIVSPTGTPPPPTRLRTHVLGEEAVHTLDVADQQWELVLEPTPEYLADQPHWATWVVLGAGLIFTVLVGAGTLIMTGRTMTIKAEVQARTEELAQINAKLAAEVCDHIRTEEALDREREFLKAVLDNLNEGILVVNATGQITMANRAAHTILVRAVGTAAALEKGWQIALPVYAADGSTPLCESELPTTRALRGETVHDFEIVLAYERAPPVRLLVTAQPLLNLEKPERSAIVVIRDITDAEKVEQLKREFVATVSHELRTPLTSIRGSLGLLSAGALGDLPEHVQRLIDIAARNTERLTFLINDLLDIEKIEQGRMHFEMREELLEPLLHQAVEAQQGYAHVCNVHIRLQGDGSNPRVFVDAQRLTQVLSNLLSNAIKFSPAGSDIVVQWERIGGSCRVAVIDQGPGIGPDFRDRIFQKFSQADSSDTRTKGGTGLGLAISKSLIEHMGGTIGFESESGRGATFFFVLPVVGW